MGKKMIMRKLLSCFTVFAILMSAMPVSVFASANSSITSEGLNITQSTSQINAKSLKEGIHILSPDSILTRTDYNMSIAVEDVERIGRYTEATAEGKKLLYGYPDAWSSYTTIWIDGSDYYQDSTMDSYVTQMPTIIGDSIVTKWTLLANVNVSQDLTLMPNTTRYRLSVTNNDPASHYVKIRYMFDTMLAYEDGAPFRVPGVGDITTEQEFINPVFDYWKAMDSLANPTLISYCAFVPYNKPYKVQFARWGAIYGAPFDYTIAEGQDITSDTAVGMYWDLGILIPGETKDVIVYYGTAQPPPPEIQIMIMDLFTEFDNYLSSQTVRGYTHIGNRGNVPLVDGQLAITITNPKDELVFETASPITINPDQTISPGFTYNLPVDVLGGVYTINATIYDTEQNVLDQREATFSVTAINLSISPENIVTSIGGSAKYEITVKNPSDIAVQLNLSLTGLDDSWCKLSKESLILTAGEEETVILNVTIPESPDNVGEYQFNVFADAKSVSAVLNVGLEPIMYELSPPFDDIRLSSNDVIFSWKTSVNSTTELYIKLETEPDFTQVIGDSGFEHSIAIENLTININYTWHVKSCSAFGCAVSENRAFYIDNGIVFTRDIYEFNIERDYNQQCFVSVKNMDSESHDLRVRAFNPYDDLYFGFIGSGSADRVISLASGETEDIELVIHAQDAMLENYTFTVNLTNLGTENITDYALVRVNVRHPHIDFDITEVSTDPITLSKTIRITNYGDPVTDLSIIPDEKLKGKVIIQPSLAHCSLGTGESVNMVISPIWSEGIRYIHGTIAATVADQSKELFVDYSCGEGKEMYPITLDHPILYFDLKGAWCINCHHVEDIFNFPPGFGKENVVYAYIGMELNAGSGQTRPYNVYIGINGHRVGTLSNTFPRGYYEFDINSSYLHYATAGTAENKYTLDTDMRSSYLTPLSDVRVVMCLDELELHICADSEEQAEEIAWSAPYIHKPSESIIVNILSPEDGSSLTPLVPVLIKAEVLGDSGKEKLCRVNATFNNSHVVIPLVDNGKHGDEQADDGVYAAEWIPLIPGWCMITVNATNCRGYDSDNVPVLVGLPVERKINLNLTIEDAYTDPVVYKAPGDVIDIVAGVTNKGTTKQDVDVTINITPHSYFDLVTTFSRDNFTALEEEPIDCVEQGNSRYSVRIEDLESDAEKQVVFRLDISENAPPARYKVSGEARVGGELYGSDLVTFDVVDNVPGIIVTNRHLLYKKYGHDLKSQNPDSVKDVKSLLKYLYEVADGEDSGEKRCIIYSVGHYNETLKNWNASDITDADYTAGENVVNKNATAIDDLIENNFTKKTDPDYLVIVGGDEIIPFYRLNDSNYFDTADNNPENSNDPVLHVFDENYFLSDSPYADTSGNDYDEGEVELSMSRIVGHSAYEMEKFVQLGVVGPEDLESGLVASRSANHDVDAIINALNNKNANIIGENNPDLTENDAWTENDLKNAMEQGFQIMAYLGHGAYDALHGTNNWPSELNADELDDINSNNCISGNNSLFVFHACRVGVVTDEDGNTWNPEWDDCMLYALVNQDSSGVVAAGGKAITDISASVGYGELLVNDYMSHLITGNQESLEFGRALQEAKKGYDEGWSWSGGDRKTVTEFMYFGVPWTTMDPPMSTDSSSQTNSSVSIEISAPTHIFGNEYFRTIEVNVTNYSISEVDGFDLVEINGSKFISDEYKPIIPTISVTLSVPLYTNITNVVIKDNVSTLIGYYNIPSIIPCEGNEDDNCGYTNQTDVVGFYPIPIYYIDESNFDEHKEIRIKVALIQYNPQTKETILYNYTKLELTYQTPVTLAITDFSPLKTEYVTGEPINTTLTVENVGSDALTGLRANLSLKDLYGEVRASSLSAPFDVALGESKTVYATVSQNLPHGSYLAEIHVLNSTGCILGSSSEYIFITSGSIVDFFLPREVVAGEDITFTIRFKNARTSGVEATGEINIYDPSDMKIAEVYSGPTNIAADSTGALSITWDTAGGDIGSYTASAVVHVEEETFGPVSDTFAIILSDTTPPCITEVRPGDITSKSGDTINFNCLVTDNIAVDSASLSYTTNNWTTYNVTQMDNPYNDFYTTTLTLPTEVGALNYKIEANDTTGNIGCSSIYTITIVRIVLFDESHGEIFFIAPNAKYSYSKFASILEDRGYEVKTLNSSPITSEKLNNCSIFVIPAPTKPFDANEIHVIREFVSNGGSLLLINEWGGDFRQGTNLNDLSKSFGISFNNDTVNDPTNNFHNTPSYALIHKFSGHYITKDVNEFLYPAGCSLVANNSIAWADDDSYTTLPNIPLVSKAEKEPGDITVLAATNFERGRVVCIGDGDFCDDLDIDGNGKANIGEYDNKKLVLNIVEWLSRGAINEPPVASFSYSPENPVVNQTITFDASSSHDPDGFITNYEWDLGDGSYGNGVIVTHAYSSTGIYNVILTVMDGDGAFNLTTREISVKEISAPEEEWNKTFGGADFDAASPVQQTAEGGYILAGLTESYGAGSCDGWLVKTDFYGNEQWNKTFGGTAEDAVFSLDHTTDGGYILAGCTNSYGAGYGDAWLVKTDSNGNKQWEKIFGGTGDDGSRSVQQTADGGYILAGGTKSYGAGSWDAWLVKTDSNGNELWRKTFGGASEDVAYSVQQTADGGYILAGRTTSYGEGPCDGWLVKTDSNGNKQWDKTFGGTGADFGESVQQTTDGGYILAGETDSYGAGSRDFWLVKIDSNGIVQWEKTFGGSGVDGADSVQQTTDGGYIIAGYTDSYVAGTRAVWLVKTDSNGNGLWNKTFGGAGNNLAESVQQTTDGGYIVAGHTDSYGAGSADCWLIKVKGR